MHSLSTPRAKRLLTTVENRGHNEAMNFWTFLDRNSLEVGVTAVLLACIGASVLTRPIVRNDSSGCRVNIGDPCAQCHALDAGTALDAGVP